MKQLKKLTRIALTFITIILLVLTGCNLTTINQTEPASETVQIITETGDAIDSDPISTPQPSPTTTPTPFTTRQPAKFVESDCDFQLPEGLREGQGIRCGFLEVPEDRENPDSQTIQLSVAILKNQDEGKNPDPIIYLEGGPGGSALEFLYLTYESNFLPLLQDGREIILFDQRGVGLSSPALDCPQEDDLSIELLDNEKDGKDLSDQEMDALIVEAYQACAEDLKEIASLSEYNTNENATDVRDLQEALGLDLVNLWGVSYGTRLALEIMRDYPEGIRSVLLDSTYPPEVNLFLEQPVIFDRVFSVFFEGCQKDPDCSAAYPNLEETFFQTVDQLNQQPAEFVVTNLLTGEEYPTIVDGDNLIGLMFQFLYDTELIPILPRIIKETNQGNYTLLALLIGSFIATQSAQSDGMHYSVQCADEIPFTSPEAVAAVGENYPQFSALFEQESIEVNWKICESFSVPPTDPLEQNPVTSEIPTLIFAGEYDPITPPKWGEMASQNLENSTFFTVPGFGHGSTLTEGCPREMAIEFFKNPTDPIDHSCLDAMTGPDFEVPDTSPVYLIEFTNRQMGIQGLVPEGWEEVNPGVFSRNNSPLDVLVVIAQAAPVSPEYLVESVSDSLGLDYIPEAVSQREVNEITWDLYKISEAGFEVDMAVASVNENGMIVLLQSLPEEEPFYYETVFLPMIDALIPIP